MCASERTEVKERSIRLCMFSLLIAFLVVSSGMGCVETAMRERGEEMNYEPIAVAVPAVTASGSIYPGENSAGSLFLVDSKARRVGDLITVLIVEQTKAVGDATTKLEAERTMSGAVSSDIGLTSLITGPAKAILKFFGLAGSEVSVANGAEVNVVSSTMTNDFSGAGKTSRSGSFTGVITCRVIDVLPGGVLHIRGRRWMVINHDAQYLTIEGLVRPEDLTVGNTVASNFIAEMSLSYDGLGVIDDKQRPGWVARIFDWVYPL